MIQPKFQKPNRPEISNKSSAINILSDQKDFFRLFKNKVKITDTDVSIITKPSIPYSALK